MSKFSILTELTMNAAGFNKGVDQAKEKTKSLKEGTEKASSAMSEVFSNAGAMFAPMTSQLSGLKSGVMAGVQSFKLMIPAINGVKMAFIATGIGAIVVALGLAFAGLVAWMKRTDEGGDSMRKVFDIIKAVINVILDKLAALGGAIVKLLKGDFKGAWADAKSAFTGWGEAIDENIKKANKLNDAQDKLEDIDETFLLKKSKIVREISELERKSKDEETYSASQRLAFTDQLKAKQNELYGLTNQKYLAELEIIKVENSQNKDNQELRQKYNDKLAEGNNLQAEHNDQLKSTQKIRQGILGDIARERDEIKKEQAELAKGLGPIKGKGINTSTDKAHTTIFSQIQANATKPLTEYQKTIWSIKQLNEDFANSFRSLSDVISDSIGKLAGSLSEGAASFKEYGKNVLGTIKNIISGYIAESVAKVITSSIAGLGKLGPAGLALIPVVAGLGAGLVKTAFNSLLPKFEFGGIVPGASFNGDKVLARVNSGEMILNGGQQANLFKMLNGVVGGNGGEVTFRIEGNTLVGVLNNYNRQQNRFR